ncbi:AMP-binding protein [Mycobacterium sp. shizuoka-1]|uniref:AMP-binding protein n=1 Tax=Mycobacterium sp. shizuoka-1 TaxID=2039281 RepID=UPI000C07A162|nr:AMP-binding protein [Mycobacterium sp. shizuoka-1]
MRAVMVLQRRGMINLVDPFGMATASRALRRYGSFGGLITYTAARYADSPALTDDTGTLSFRDLDQLSNAAARVLLDRQLGDESAVGLLNRGHRGLLIALAAAGKAGVRTVLLNTGFAGPQLRDVCARERIGLVLADDEFTDALTDLPAGVEVLLNWSERLTTLPVLDDLAAAQSADRLPPPERPGGLVLLTSGTTGSPKGAPRDNVSPLQSAQLLDRVPWPGGGCYVVAAPLFHATGLATASVGLALGNRVALTRRFDPVAALAAIERHRASTLIVVPTMLSRILDLGPEIIGRYDTSSLAVIFAAGSTLAPQLCRRTLDTFGDVLYNLYGSTEVATAAVATPAELRVAPGTVGRPPVGCRIAAYDADDHPITRPGQTGTLYVSSGLSFSGYTDGGTKRVIDGMMCSGDTGHFDERGLWYVDGRDDDMIVSGGENVYPVEVENLLSEHPDIVEAAVVGVDDHEFGQRLGAYVVLRAGAAIDADGVKAHVRARLARHKVPRDVVFLAALPRNETGKVLKKNLVLGTAE